MWRAEILADKWSQPGWRIEQKYSSKVLVGNWMEERLPFTREATTAGSTTRLDYRPHWDSRPDFSTRAEGLSSKLVFAHPGPPSSNDLITRYQESYGVRGFPSLPALQPWKTDRPDLAHLGSRRRTNNSLDKQASHLPSLTLYESTYQRHPPGAFCRHRAARASRSTSSNLLAVNHLHKDLRTRQRVLLQVPDPDVY